MVTQGQFKMGFSEKAWLTGDIPAKSLWGVGSRPRRLQGKDQSGHAKGRYRGPEVPGSPALPLQRVIRPGSPEEELVWICCSHGGPGVGAGLEHPLLWGRTGPICTIPSSEGAVIIISHQFIVLPRVLLVPMCFQLSYPLFLSSPSLFPQRPRMLSPC